MVQGKDYIGGVDQLPVAIRLMNLLVDLFFCNGYCMKLKLKKKSAQNDKICQEKGWQESSTSSPIKQRRTNVLHLPLNNPKILECLIQHIFVEEKIIRKNNWLMSPSIHYLRSCNLRDSLSYSLLSQIISYKENGILPYSAYIFRGSNEASMYCAALAVGLSLKIFQTPSVLEEQEIASPDPNVALMMTGTYLENQGKLSAGPIEGPFVDEEFLASVFTYILDSIRSCYQQHETFLPFSFKENPLIEELVYLLLSILNQHDLCVEVLSEIGESQQVLPTLLVLLDNLVEDLQNGLFHSLLSLFLKLSAVDSFGSLLNCPLTIKYKFKSLPVLSGTVNDFFFGLLFVILTKNLKKQFPSDDIFEFVISILSNTAASSFGLQHNTCLLLFDLLRKLEDYPRILRDPKLMQVALDLFFVIEKLLVFNWAHNSLLAAYLWLNKDLYGRLRSFGTSRDRLGRGMFRCNGQRCCCSGTRGTRASRRATRRR